MKQKALGGSGDGTIHNNDNTVTVTISAAKWQCECGYRVYVSGQRVKRGERHLYCVLCRSMKLHSLLIFGEPVKAWTGTLSDKKGALLLDRSIPYGLLLSKAIVKIGVNK